MRREKQGAVTQNLEGVTEPEVGMRYFAIFDMQITGSLEYN